MFFFLLEEAFYFRLFILEAVLVRPCVGLAVQVPVFLEMRVIWF